MTTKRTVPFNNRAPATIILVGIALSVLTLFAFWGVQNNGFIAFDDPVYVTDNPSLQRGLTWETMKWTFTSSRASNWHPLTWLSLLLDRSLFGMNPAGYHWTSLVIHLLSGLLFLAALHRMTGSLWRSSIVAALFLIHPLHVESVAWVAERKDVLCGLFWMLGLWCYARYVEKPGPVRYFFVFFSFLGCLTSKPMGVTFPFLLLVLDGWPLGRLQDRTAWAPLFLEKVPLLLLSAAGSAVTFLIQQEDQAMPPLSIMPMADRLANGAVSYVAYLVKTVWPTELSIYYPYLAPPPLALWGMALIVLMLITLVSFVVRKRSPYLLSGWLWYLGTLIPVIGLVQVGSQAMADRYTYLPLGGIFLIFVWGAWDMIKGHRQAKGIGVAAAASIVLSLIALTRTEVSYWKDTPTLFGRALHVTERNYMAHQILGEWSFKGGDLAGAENHYREAIRISPTFKLPCNDLGYLMILRGNLPEASQWLEKALKTDPDYAPALKNLGDVRMRTMRMAEAVVLYRGALLHGDREVPELWNNLGVALFFLGQREEAIEKVQEAIRLKPDYAEAKLNLQRMLVSADIQGKPFR